MSLPPQKALDRKLGLISIMAISIGAAAAPGIFILPALAADVAGPMVGLSYLLAGIMVLPAVFSKAELASSMPVAGGTYVYIERSLGPLMGTITGIGTWLSLSAKTAFALVGLRTYLVYFTSSANTLPITIAILLLLLGLNAAGVGKVKLIQSAIVVFLLACVFFLTSVGTVNANLSYLEPMFPHEGSGILAGAALV